MSRAFVCGLGAVSPAGWSVAALRQAVDQGVALQVVPLSRPGWDRPLRTRPVPNPPHALDFLSHPRLRRTSAITHYAVASAFEALDQLRTAGGQPGRLGIVVCLQSGCVQYSQRFFEEVLRNPATASPLLFPETVFAAPGSHIAALMGNTPLICTLMGDPAVFLPGIALAVQWLEADRVDTALVVGAEETNWLLADALWHFEHATVISGGAGAVCLSLNGAVSLGTELDLITDVHTYARRGRGWAARAMRAQLPAGAPDELLCDGLGESYRAGRPEREAWRDWTGARLSPKRLLGEGLMAAAAWQVVAATDAVARGRFAAATVSLVGSNQQAVGARFVRVEPGRTVAPAGFA